MAAPAVDHPDIDKNLFAELHRYCREGQLSELRNAFNYEKRIQKYFEIRTQRGYTLIHEAVECDQGDVVQLLLLHKVPPDIRAKTGLTPLHIAASKGYVGCVRALLEAGADITLRDDLGHDAMTKAERSKRREAVQKLLLSKEIILLAERGDVQQLEKRLSARPKQCEMRDIEEALLTAIHVGNEDAIPLLVVAGARRLDCALYLAIQLERIKSIAILLLCKATITDDCQAIRSLLSEPPDCDNAPWYMHKVHEVLTKDLVKMSYPIAVSIMEKNYDATKELLLKTDLDMRRKQVDWSKLKLTLLHPSWMYSIAPWVVSLKLVNNHLRTLPRELFSASQLRRLDLSHNLLESLCTELFALPNLEYLCLSHNRLKEIPDTSVWSPSLLSLDLSENGLQTLPLGIQHSSIEILNLSKNHFTSVPKCLCRIRTLTSLDLSSMPITSLPKEMENLDHLVNLNVSNVNISDLPGGGILRGRLRGLFKARARSNKPCNYVKLVILCHSNAAKLVMYSRLKPNVGIPQQTSDIDVFQWSYRPLLKIFQPNQKVFFNTWLIGSCHECSCIYPCFFTQSALYVIVWDMTKTGELREQIKPYVDLLVQHAPTANVLVIATLPELNDAWFDTNADSLARRLSHFFGKSAYKSLTYQGLIMMAINLTAREAQSELKQRLYDVASTMSVNGQQVTARQFPENYFSLIPVLEKEQGTFSVRGKPGVLEENAIWSLFDQALSSDPPDKMELPVMIDFLKEAGFLLHYQDPNDRLDQYYFTRPEWLYHTLLRVVRHALHHPNHLVLTFGELCALANVDWSKDVSSALVRLMIRYAIVIPVKHSHFLIPCLLPHSNIPTSQMYVGTLRRQFAPKTKALPADLWYRIICKVLSNLSKIIEVRRRAILNDLKQVSEAEKSAQPDSLQDTEKETSDEETDSHGSKRSMKRLCSLGRGSSEPILSIQSDSADQPEESSLDSLVITRPRSGARYILQDQDSCSLENSTEEVCELTPPSPRKSDTKTTFEGVVRPRSEKQGETIAPDNEKSVKRSHESDEASQKKHEASPNISPEPHKVTETKAHKAALSNSSSHTRTSHTRTLTTRVTQASETSEDSDTTRSCSLPLGAARPRFTKMVSTPPKQRANSYSEPISINRGTKVWNRGITYDYNGIKFSIYPCFCDMSSVEERGIEICTTRNSTGRVVLARLCRLVQKLLEERYPDLFSVDVHLHKHELTQLAICPVCLENSERNPTSFLVEACVHALREKGMHTCRYHKESIPLRDLIPDYLLVDLPASYRLTSASFQYGDTKALHRSRSTTLFQGTFQGESVAIKFHVHMEGKSITLPLSNVRQEVEMLIQLDHPNIVRTFGCCLHPPCVLLEKAPLGNLYQKLMDTEQRISRTMRFHISCQVASALDYLHTKDIIYRTLKASSILVWSLEFADEVSIKLTNFERAEFKSPSGLLGKTEFASYLAPEILRYSFREEYSEKADIYSFGILLYELITRWQPFGGTYNSDRLPGSRRPNMSGIVTTGYGTLVKVMEECWQEDLTSRPTASTLVKLLSLPAFQCHITTQALRDCISVRGCCFVPSMRQIWVYGEYNKQTNYGESFEIEGTQVFILNAENLTIQGSLELRERATSIFTIDNKVCIGMTEACVHAYDSTTFRFTDRLYLSDSVTVIADNESYVFVGQASGELAYYPKLKFLKEFSIIEIGKKPIISMISVGDDIWLSCGNEIVVLSADDKVYIEARWSGCDESDSIYALVLSRDGTTVWSLIRRTFTITSWSVTSGGTKMHTVDFTKELNWICCEYNYDPSFLRLVSLACVNNTLWLGLTCGVIVILTATDQPEVIAHFRAHKKDTKCLMEVPISDAQNQDNPIVLSGGFGEVSSLSNSVTEQNGVVMSWQTLPAKEFELLIKRYQKHLDVQP